MPLVNYPSSSDDEALSSSILSKPHSKSQPSESRRPKPSLPPLPKDFHDLYAFAARTSVQDDPELHGGRQRSTPHVEGLWPTHVYIGWVPSQIELARLENILDERSKEDGSSAKTQIHSLLRSDLGVPLPLHISLSRSLSLQKQEREPFLQSIGAGLQDLHLPGFDLKFDGLDWVSNYEGNRWFLVLRIADTEKTGGLTKLLGLSNIVAQAFGQPPLYEGALDHIGEERLVNQGGVVGALPFHVSIGWTLSNPSTKMTLRNGHSTTLLEDLALHVGEVKVKFGNDVASLPLASDDDGKVARHGIIE